MRWEGLSIIYLRSTPQHCQSHQNQGRLKKKIKEGEKLIANRRLRKHITTKGHPRCNLRREKGHEAKTEGNGL